MRVSLARPAQKDLTTIRNFVLKAWQETRCLSKTVPFGKDNIVMLSFIVHAALDVFFGVCLKTFDLLGNCRLVSIPAKHSYVLHCHDVFVFTAVAVLRSSLAWLCSWQKMCLKH